MYVQVKSPKKVTQKFLNKAFAPLNDYLEKEIPEHKNEILGYMMFIGNDKNEFHYKHKISREYIIFNQEGGLVSCSENAIQYKFDWDRDDESVVSMQEKFIHPSVSRWAKSYLKKKSFIVYQEVVSQFLQDVWGPVINFNFDSLKVGYPSKGTSSTLYITSPSNLFDIAFEFVGDDIAMRKCKLSTFLKYEELSRKLMHDGWKVFTFTLDGVSTYQIEPLKRFLSRELCEFAEDTKFVLNNIPTDIE